MTGKAIHVSRNIKGRSYYHCYSGRAISMTYCECGFVALGIQHATHMRHIIICDLHHSTIFFSHYLINGTILEKTVAEHKMCVLIFSTTFV